MKQRVLILAAVLLLAACKPEAPTLLETSPPEIYARKPTFVTEDTRQPCRDRYPENHAFFGALHIHTSLSDDAWIFGNENDPDDAYAFSSGRPLIAPIAGDSSGNTLRFEIDRPLDFAAVTDHAEQFGQQSICKDPNHKYFEHKACLTMRGETWWAKFLPDDLNRLARIFSAGGHGPTGVNMSDICDGDPSCTSPAAPVWQQIQRSAEEWYDRSEDCEFTTFVGYEYSLTPGSSGNGLHRNVLFKNATVLNLPVSARLAERPIELWRYLDEACNKADNDCEVLAIPHNINLSGGEMFAPIYSGAQTQEEEAEIAALRIRTEPLVEIYQQKGDSECRNGMQQINGLPDEFCDFEKLRSPTEELVDCMDDIGERGMAMTGCVSRRNYVRYALTEGLEEADRIGVNPFELGIIAASDTHNSNGGDVAEYDNKSTLAPSNTPQKRLQPETVLPGGIASVRRARYSPGGLAGIYAPQNTREDLFESMRRRETFGTSGPRIVPRFFAGSELPKDLCDSTNMIAEAYADGVPMGGKLPIEKDESSPRFLVTAVADTGTADHPGGLLQRIQIVKGWSDEDGEHHQRVINVAGDPNNGASVDLNTCQPKGSGYQGLCAVWEDPDFDPARRAFYYARVLENPSCRWSTYECNRLTGDDRPETCDDPSYPKTIQERAWTSPIWVEPARAHERL